MKIPFDIEKAKAGAKVVTRDNQLVRILTFDKRVSVQSDYPIVGLIDTGDIEVVTTFQNNGANGHWGNDLFLEVEPEYKPFDLSNAPVGRIVMTNCKVENRHKTLIVEANPCGVTLANREYDFSYSELLENYVFEDGSPCGVLEN